METIVAILIAALAGIFVFKRKADKAETEAKLAATKAKDQALAEQQQEVEAAIQSLDAGIERMKAQKEIQDRKRAEDNMSLKERADRIKKGLQ
jgi:hypothetical protein